jgi:hypothetical protein
VVRCTAIPLPHLKGDLRWHAAAKQHTGKQKREAKHIAEGYEKRGTSHKEAERRAWATVNKQTHGGKKSGSGRGKAESHASSRKGGKIGGHSVSHAARSRAAKKGWETRRRNGS